METNPNTPEGETPSEEKTAPNFIFTNDYSMEDHRRANEAGIDPDFELSKNCFSKSKLPEPVVDDSHFTGKYEKPFDIKVDIPTDPEKKPLPKGVDYRNSNNSSLL